MNVFRFDTKIIRNVTFRLFSCVASYKSIAICSSPVMACSTLLDSCFFLLSSRSLLGDPCFTSCAFALFLALFTSSSAVLPSFS